MVYHWCAIVAEGIPFAVRIDEIACVEQLKDAFKANNEDIDFPAHLVQLYLASRGDAWLTDKQIRNLSSIEGVIHISDSYSTFRSVGGAILLCG